MSCYSATWAGFGLPLPDAGVSGYEVDLGLVRTPADDGTTRQRRRYRHWPRAWQVQWTVDVGTLQTMTAWVDTFGDSYQPITLISGESADGSPALHQVRFASDLDVAPGPGLTWLVRATLEQGSGSAPADTTGWAWPIAMRDSYGYREAYGLIRTPFAASVQRQTRVYTQRPRMFNASWRLTHAQLAVAEAWMRAEGTAYHDWSLISAESGAGQVTTHTARVASNLSVALLSGGLADLSCSLEQACANEVGALEAEVSDQLLTCVLAAPDSVALDTDDAQVAADWGDATDWGRSNP